MMQTKSLLLSVIMFPLMGLLVVAQQSEVFSDDKVIYNQVGYTTHAKKMLLVTEDVEQVDFINANGRIVLRVEPEAAMYWEKSGDAVRKVDFSDIRTAGKYTVQLPGENRKFEIEISERPYEQLAKDALRAFYYNRSGMPIEQQYGGKWARPAGHPDTCIFVHASAADKHRPEGTKISSPGGWYDAGDYNKYIVNSGISTFTLFRALEDYPEYFSQLEVNIPAQGIPHLLAETMYNYQWMLTMQDPEDGGVYHKLTNKNFEGSVMPHDALSQRYVVSKTTTAALDFAAVAARASIILQAWESHFPGLAATSLVQAEKAWQWAIGNPDVHYNQPEDIATGAYGDRQTDDEFFWAAAELFLATHNQTYLRTIIEKYRKPSVPTWSDVYSLGVLSLMNQYEELPQQIKNLGLQQDFYALLDQLTAVSQSSAYGISIENFAWGSNSSVANEGMLKLAGYRLSGQQKYLQSAMADLDYILGRNATGYCFVTGYGHKKVMNIHHRPSEADGIEDPVPGFLAGGPNTAVFTDCPPDTPRSRYPANSYVDLQCSYSTNEIAINWNAPLVYLTGGIDALTISTSATEQ